MPDPNKFDNKRDWMDACMHQCVRVEGKDQKESVGQCLGMWASKMKKKKKASARRVLASYLEAIDKESSIFGIPIDTKPQDLRRVHTIWDRHHTETRAEPAKKDIKFAEPGEMIPVIDVQTGKIVEKPYDPKKMKLEKAK